MSYRLYSFGGVVLPLIMAEDDLSTGGTESGLLESVGGGFDAYGGRQVLAQRKTIRQSGMYEGSYSRVIDEAGFFVIDQSNRILGGTGRMLLQAQVDRLKALAGVRSTLVRLRESDGAQQGVTARLLRVEHEQKVDDVDVARLVSMFETLAAAWRSLGQSTVTAEAAFIAWSAGNAPVRDGVLTVTAVGTVNEVRVESLQRGVALQWAGVLGAGQSLVIDAGAQTVRAAGVDAYSGLRRMSGHWARDWLPLEPGDNTYGVTTGGTATAVLSWYDAWM